MRRGLDAIRTRAGNRFRYLCGNSSFLLIEHSAFFLRNLITFDIKEKKTDKILGYIKGWNLCYTKMYPFFRFSIYLSSHNPS